MGSIDTGGSAYGETYIGDDFPTGPWAIVAWAEAGVLPAPHAAGGIFAGLFGPPDFIRPSFNSREDNPDIRYGSFDQEIGAFTEVDFADQAWTYYVLSSGGGSAPVRWTIVSDQGEGTWTITESYEVSAATLGTPTTDLIFSYFGTIGGASRVHEPLKLTSHKIYTRDLWNSGAGSGADIIAQARTREVLWPADLFGSWQWDGSTTSGLATADEGVGWFYETFDATGITTSTSEPSFPDDAEEALAVSAAFVAPAFEFSASAGVRSSTSAAFVAPATEFSAAVGVRSSTSFGFVAPVPSFSAALGVRAAVAAAFVVPVPSFSASAGVQASLAAAFVGPEVEFSASIGELVSNVEAGFVAPVPSFSALIGVGIDLEGFAFVAPVPSFSARIATRAAPSVARARTLTRYVEPMLLVREVP